MKNKLLILLLCIVTIINLTGCSLLSKNISNIKKEKVTKQTLSISKKKMSKLVGKYELIDLKTDEKSYLKKDFEKLKEHELGVTLELKDDKTAILDLFGDKQEFKFNNKYFYTEDDKIRYSFKEKKLKVYNSEETLIFRKTE